MVDEQEPAVAAPGGYRAFQTAPACWIRTPTATKMRPVPYDGPIPIGAWITVDCILLEDNSAREKQCA